jgi:hypothetical protein
MQRVAAKPRQARRRSSVAASAPVPKPQTARTSRARASAGSIADDVEVRELPQRRSGESAVRRPRTETALAWAMWELTTVPVRRWEWFKQFARGRDENAATVDRPRRRRVDESLDPD